MNLQPPIHPQFFLHLQSSASFSSHTSATAQASTAPIQQSPFSAQSTCQQPLVVHMHIGRCLNLQGSLEFRLCSLHSSPSLHASSWPPPRPPRLAFYATLPLQVRTSNKTKIFCFFFFFNKRKFMLSSHRHHSLCNTSKVCLKKKLF